MISYENYPSDIKGCNGQLAKLTVLYKNLTQSYPAQKTKIYDMEVVNLFSVQLWCGGSHIYERQWYVTSSSVSHNNPYDLN